MARYYDFDNLQNVVCAACLPPIIEELKLHQTTLKVIPEKCVFDPSAKTASIAISDDSELTDDEISEEIRFVLSDWIPPKAEEKKEEYHLAQAAVGMIFGGAMMLIMMMNIELASWLHHTFLYSGIAVAAVIGYPSLKKAWNAAWRHRKINMDSLFALSTIIAVAASIMHHFYEFIPSLFDAALMINAFRHIGLYIEESYTSKVTAREKFVDRGRSSRFKIKRGDVYVDYAGELKDIPVGSVLKIPRGQCIPLNGELLDESGSVTFVMNTGKEDTEHHRKGDTLCAGMIADSMDVTIKVTATENDSYLRARDLSMINAQSKKAPITDFTSTLATWFMPGVLILSLAAFFSGFALGFDVGMKAALYLMVVACPCALGLVTPMGVNIGLNKLRDDGVTFKTAKGLQAAAEVDTIICDLNGTMTQNKPRLTRHTIDKEYFPIIHAMEAGSTHSIGKVISDVTAPDNQSILSRVYRNVSSALSGVSRYAYSWFYSDYIDKGRNGISARFQGDVYKIGNKDFVNPPQDKWVDDFGDAQHAIYFSKNGIVEGYFLLEDPLRDKELAVSMVQNIQKNCFNFKVLTSTSADVAAQYAKQMGLPFSCFVTSCVPTHAPGENNKCDYIKALQSQGHKVAMFGDAGNDVEAIKAADFGVVVNSSSTDPMAIQEADASINSDTLFPQIMKLFAVGQQTMRQIKQNLCVSFLYNSLSLVYVSCAMLLKPELLIPAVGAGLMIFQSLLIVMNALRINLQPATLPVEYKAPPKPSAASALRLIQAAPTVSPGPAFYPQYDKSVVSALAGGSMEARSSVSTVYLGPSSFRS